MTNRSTAERVLRARARLDHDPNVWIATSSPDGIPHLVPLSLAWIDERIVVATPADSPTARNAATTRRARAALDSASDVVIVDADVDTVALADADPSLLERYVERVGWDPRHEQGEWSLLVLAPRRAHAWNGPAEIDDRTILRHGNWLDA